MPACVVVKRVADQDKLCFQPPLHKIPWFPVSPPQLPRVARRSQLPTTSEQGEMNAIARYDQMNTWMPLLVAALTASTSLSYVGSKVSVKAESRIRPRTCTPMSTFRTSPFCKTRPARKGSRQIALHVLGRLTYPPIVSPAFGV